MAGHRISTGYMEKTPHRKMTKNTKLLTAIIAVLVVINLLQMLFSQHIEQKKQEEVGNKQGELVMTFMHLDSLQKEFEYKIAVVEELNGQVDSLMAIRNLLINEKDALQRTKDYTQDRLDRLVDRMEGYETLLKRKDEEIAKLRQLNETLYVENITLRNQNNEFKDEIVTLRARSGELQQRINLAAILKAINIQLKAEDRSGLAKAGTEFKAKQLDKLHVGFELEENQLAGVGNKKLLLRLIDPDGSALYNLKAGSGTFRFNGEDLFYTSAQEVAYRKERMPVSFSFAKGSEFRKGSYTAEIYCDGAKIGTTVFDVN